MRVVFFGNAPLITLPVLYGLLETPGVQLAGIVSPAVKGGPHDGEGVRHRLRRAAAGALARLPAFFYDPLARGRERVFVETARIAHRCGVPLLRPRSMCADEAVDQIAALQADVVVMAGFDRILRPKLLDRLPCVWNVHSALLPRRRGPLPEFWTLVQGDPEAGVTIHYVTAGIDEGDIVAQVPVLVDAEVTGGELRRRCARAGAALLRDALAAYRRGARARLPQSGPGTYDPKPGRADLLAPFEHGARAVFDRARAAAPWTGVEVTVPSSWWERNEALPTRASHDVADDRVRLTLEDATLLEDVSAGPPGTLRRDEAGALVLACRGGAVRFLRAHEENAPLQPPSAGSQETQQAPAARGPTVPA